MKGEVAVADDDTEAVLVAYGSNLSSGARSASQSFDLVVKTLKENGVIVTKISRLWQSQAWPNPADPPYVNAVLEVKTALQPTDFMAVLHEVEQAFGRVRTGEKNAPRTVDLDLIAYGRRVSDREGGVILPHPRAADRGFVMGPLAEILPEWVHPVLKRTAAELFADVTVAADAHPLDEG